MDLMCGAAGWRGGERVGRHAAFSKQAWREVRTAPFRDRAFTEADWNVHVTWRRYLPELPVITVVLLTLSPLWLWSMLVSALVGVYATYAEPNGWPLVSTHSEFLAPFTLTSFALSLLLLYKTNSAYGRWWEARTQLGTLYIVSRSIQRLNLAWVGRRDPALAHAAHRWIAAVMPSLCAHLRKSKGGTYYPHFLEGVLSAHELEWLRARNCPPIAALQVLSGMLLRAELSDYERTQVELLLNQCDTVIGACERIYSTAMPLAYNRHAHRFLLTFITFLPFALWPLFEWMTCAVMPVLSFLLVATENIGIQIEEPFRVLDLPAMCRSTLRALSTMAEDWKASQDLAASALSEVPSKPPTAAVAPPVHAEMSSSSMSESASARPPGNGRLSAPPSASDFEMMVA